MCDLLLLWEWAHDADFVERVLRLAEQVGVSALAAGPSDLKRVLETLTEFGTAPGFVVDRASDVHPEAARIARWACSRGSRVVNAPDRVGPAADKSIMHLALMSAGVHVPWTIVLPPSERVSEERLAQLAQVGRPFVVKPAHGGGGEGVILEATTRSDIEGAIAGHDGETFLIQERVVPQRLRGRPAYFRVLYCLGDIHPCFWDPESRRYGMLSQAERETEWGPEIARIMRAIATVSGMDLFSSEVARTPDGRMVAVDYVNDMCDLRPASRYPDGVPDPTVDAVASRLVMTAKQIAPSPKLDHQ